MSSTEEDTFNEEFKSFIAIAHVKGALNITDDTHDDQITHIVSRANDAVTNILSKYMDIPVPDGILIPKCRHVAEVLAISMWHR